MKSSQILGGIALVGILLVALPCPARADIHFYSLARNSPPDSDLYAYSHYQEQTMWCWAAVVQMAYGLQGAEIPQPNIVALIKGGYAVNEPARAEDVAFALTRIAHDKTNELVT